MAADFPKMSLKDARSYFRADFFQNGLAYYHADKVLNPSRYQNKLYAQVQGSGKSAYNVLIEFDEKPKATCTCPAARRYNLCKHAAAVLAGWASDPSAFVVADHAPEFTTSKSKRARVKKGKTDTNELIATGIEALETLTTEFVLSGLSAITPDRVEQVRDLAENLRTYKLRRLSTLLIRFAEALNVLVTDKDHFSLSEYTSLLVDIVITAKGVQGIQQGKLQDPKYMEELVGKTWQEKELTPRHNVELLEIYFNIIETVDGFRVFSSYFVELESGEIVTEKLIIPKHLKKGQTEKRSYAGSTLTVSEGYQYPGYPPFRLKLKEFHESPASAQNIERIIAKAPHDFRHITDAFKTFKKDLFAPDDYYTLLKPEGFYASDTDLVVFDVEGTAFSLLLTDRSTFQMQQLLETSTVNVLFGKLHAIDGLLKFEPLSAIRQSAERAVIAL